LVPNSFQGNRASNTKATYALDGKDHRVQNQCKDAAGKTTGIAKIVEGSNNSKLRVSFFRPFYDNYWVLVGEPKCAFGWVLARDNKLDAATLNQILDRAAAQGYDRSAFKISL
jgi:apolipoprotein D and lipocalin family protein